MGRLQDEIKQSKPFRNLETEAYLNLVMLTQQLSDRVSQLIKTAGLSQNQYNVLRILRGAGPNGLACHEVCERMVHRVPDLTRLVERLGAANLIEREREATDKRVVRIRITQAGLDQIAPLDEPLVALHHELLGHLGDARLRDFIALLEQARYGRENATACNDA